MESPVSDVELAQGILRKVATDLEAILDRPLAFDGLRVERRGERPSGEGDVHVSFRFSVDGLDAGGDRRHGSLLVPLPDAMAMGAYLMMLPDEVAREQRRKQAPDLPMKEALLEIGSFMAGAVDSVLRAWIREDLSVRAEGCQGVRAGVRPAFPYREGDELLVARARASLGEEDDFELLLVLPPPAAEPAAPLRLAG